MITRPQALELLHTYQTPAQLLTHALETEAVMQGLAEHCAQDAYLWGLTGLLHDLDYPQTADTPQLHGLQSAKILAGHLPEQACLAIARHNERNGSLPQTNFDFALRCGETVTGLIHAAMLVRPEGLQGMTPKSLRKKMKDKSFAASVSRERIHECEKIRLELTDFLHLAIKALQGLDHLYSCTTPGES